MQWQILTWVGSILASKLIWPQWQRPVTFITISPGGTRPMPGVVTPRITRFGVASNGEQPCNRDVTDRTYPKEANIR